MSLAPVPPEGFLVLRLLPNGRIAGLLPMIFTVGVAVDVEADGTYSSRWCYPDLASAAQGLLDWDGTGDPPGPWLKHKGAPGGDRSNPTIGGVPVVTE
jgi:hypothetical protein